VETEAGEQLVRHCAESLDRAYDDSVYASQGVGGWWFVIGE
jgi:hypothetical protein